MELPHIAQRAASHDERGSTLVIAAVFMPVLLIFCGFAVDLGNWYLHIQRAQRAADSAALAGAVYLPGDPAKAAQVARATLQDNDFDGTEIRIAPFPGYPDHLEVTVGDVVPNALLTIIGMDDFQFQRTAVGVWEPRVMMGSPYNTLGIQPVNAELGDDWTAALLPGQTNSNDYWLNVAGTGESKAHGDRWGSGTCAKETEFNFPWKCDSSLSPPNANQEYDPAGAEFVIRVDPGASGTLAIEAYDAPYSPSGAYCNTPNWQYVFAQTANPLYEPGNRSFCADSGYDGSVAPDLTFKFDGSPAAGSAVPCPALTFEPLDGTEAQWLEKLTTPSNDPTAPSNAVHKWTRICTFEIGGTFPAGDYVMRARARDGSDIGNHFSLRAAFLLPSGKPHPAMSQKVHIYGAGRLRVNSTYKGAEVTVHMAKVSNIFGGRTVRLEAFDLGDSSNERIERMSVVLSPDSRVNGVPTTAVACTHSLPHENVKSALSPCVITGIQNKDYDAVPSVLDVQIPKGFSCDTSASTGCWILLKLEYGATTDAGYDHVSFSAGGAGRPLRLVDPRDLK